MKRRKNREEDSSDRWLVSYADFVTLLFAFFTVLFATSQQDADKGKKFEESVKKYLIKTAGGGSTGKNININVKNNTPIKEPIKQHSKPNPKITNLQKKVQTYLEENITEDTINKIIQDLSNEELGVRISVKAEALFNLDSLELKESAGPLLLKIGNLIKSLNYRVFIEGHFIKGKNSWDKAAQMSTLLVRYLTKVQKVNPVRLAAISYGSSRPLFPWGSEDANKNRRLEILIIAEDLPF